MKLSFCNLILLRVLLSKATTAAATNGRSVRGASAPVLTIANGEEFMEDDREFKSMRFLSQRRRLLAHEGVMRTLIIRVTDNQGKEPITDYRRESDVWFGTYNLTFADNVNSMSSIYDQCSGGKLIFVPATGTNVVDGVLELTVDVDMEGTRIAEMIGPVRNAFNALNANLGIEFEAYSMILPTPVKGCGGLARQGGDHQIYSCGADRSLELVVHEFGHNLGFHHSGLPDAGDYDDNSCMMGCCTGAQQMCFNAAKSWYSGWYSDVGKEGHEDLNYFATPGEWWKGNLVGIDDYLNGVYDEDQHRVVTRIRGGLFMMFNRKKGINGGVKANADEVVIVQQWGESGRSKVLGTLNEENQSFIFSDRELYDFDIVVKLCEIFYAPVVTGPQIFGGTASQSSTAVPRAEAGRAIDGNLDQSWAGGSVTHTEGDDDLDPWWLLTLDSPEAVEHIRIYNRGDCCGSRLDNAIVELVDANGDLLYSHNLGIAVSVRELYLGRVYDDVKEIKIKLLGNKVLSLAEVEIFGPLGQPRTRLPDHAQVMTYVSNSLVNLDCDTSEAPTLTPSPSLAPTISFQPSIYKAIPNGVVLLRDDSLCISQVNPSNHPDRFKCMLQSTNSNSEPGGHDNASVALRGQDGCLVIVQPVAWAWSGNAFIFQSSESLDGINSCFSPATHILELGTTVTPSTAPSVEVVPNDVILLRDDAPCVFQHNPSNHPDRFKCMLQPTTSSSEPGGHDNEPVALRGKDGCLVIVQPVTWAWGGDAFIFQSSKSLDGINACFAPGTLINKSAPTATPSAAPSVEVIPNDVMLLRDETPCIFQHNPSNHPDRFKCMLQSTTSSSEPGGHDNEPVTLRGQDGCLVIVQPVTWAWGGDAFIFQSSKSLDGINACFAPGTLINKSAPTASPSARPSVEAISDDVVLLRDETPCVFQHNPSNHPDRFKCMLQPTTPSSQPGGHGNDLVRVIGDDCFVDLKPVTWAWAGNAFVFQSKESLDAINDCFAAGTLITRPNSLPSVLFP